MKMSKKAGDNTKSLKTGGVQIHPTKADKIGGGTKYKKL